MPETERSVACGGFATEIILLQAGHIKDVDLTDSKGVSEVSARVFSNAWQDHQEFIGRTVTEDNDFTIEEKKAFMDYATERVVPIIRPYVEKMRLVVNELLAARNIDGTRVREILEIDISRRGI